MISRRGFTNILSLMFWSSITSPIRAVTGAPIIWCDGVHDDAPGINALIRNEAVHFRIADMEFSNYWSGDTFIFDGEFTLKSPVYVDSEFSGKRFNQGIFYHDEFGFFDVTALSVTFYDMDFKYVRGEL